MGLLVTQTGNNQVLVPELAYLSKIKGTRALFRPSKLDAFLCQFNKRSCNVGKVGNVSPIVGSKAQELADLSSCVRLRPLPNALYLLVAVFG